MQRSPSPSILINRQQPLFPYIQLPEFIDMLAQQDFILNTVVPYTIVLFLLVLAFMPYVLPTIKKNFNSFVISILKLGPIPQHIAFIMDGNRRYAKREQMETAVGHEHGFKKLEEILEWCMNLGIKMVTVYAFSVENFKRDEKEVNALMTLAKEKMIEMANEHKTIEKHGIAVKVCGELHLLPKDVLEAAHHLMEVTKRNKHGVLNICMPYTSRHEIMQGVKEYIQSPRQYSIQASFSVNNQYNTSTNTTPTINHIPHNDIHENNSSYDPSSKFNFLTRHFQISDSPALDILIRTSGEIRLSDFMLWQACDDCYLYFTSVLWPEFNFRDFMPILLNYQYQKLKKSKSSDKQS